MFFGVKVGYDCRPIRFSIIIIRTLRFSKMCSIPMTGRMYMALGSSSLTSTSETGILLREFLFLRFSNRTDPVGGY